MLMQTWRGFVKVARQLYGVSEDELLDRMRKVGVSATDVLCYLNTQPEYGMTEEEIAIELNMTQPNVHWHLRKVRAKWPHIFATNQTFQYDPRKHDPHVIKKY